VAAEYIDNSKSGFAKNVRRPKYEEMVAAAKSGQIDGVIVWDLDRLTRQPRQLEDWCDMGEVRGFTLVTVDGSHDLSTENGRMFARIKASVARQESEHKAKRQKFSNEQRAKMGRPPHTVGPSATTLTAQSGKMRQSSSVKCFRGSPQGPVFTQSRGGSAIKASSTLAASPGAGKRSRVAQDRQQITDLAIEHLTDRTQGREPDRLCPVVLEHRQIYQTDSDTLAQLSQGHAAVRQQLVQMAVDVRRLLRRH
jgi:hypothetical protein